MKIILLKGQQGTLKTSVWGPAIAQHFEQSGKRVHYIDCLGSQREYDRAVAQGNDVIIVETNLAQLPFTGPQPDFTISCERHNPDDATVSALIS